MVKTASAPGTPATRTRGLLRCGQAAGLIFVAVFLLEGARRDDYRPLRHPVSSLALGPRGWIQTDAVLAWAGFGHAPRFVRLGGLFQRASIITGFGWLTALSARALRHAPGRNPESGVGSGRGCS